MELSNLSEKKIDHTLAGDEQLRRDQLLLHEQLSEQNRDLREAHLKSLNEKEELKRFQGSRFDELPRRRCVENQDTILEFTEFRNYRMKLIVWMMREILNMLNQYAINYATFPINHFTPPFRDLGPDAQPFCGNAEPQRQAARHLGYARYIGKCFCKSNSVFFITISWRIQSVDFQRNGTHITACNE